MEITAKDLAAREKRFDTLARGLGLELVEVRGNTLGCPLLYRERRAYPEAVAEALAGVETARVVLAKARQRRERGRGG